MIFIMVLLRFPLKIKVKPAAIVIYNHCVEYMNNNIQDHAERKRALNPTQSFIVQAPAGSGKTELLIQRYLVLLARIKHPEEILAITFTKKSAAEMRSRIVNALNNATQPMEPLTDHAKTTRELALKVLQQDQQLKWDLLMNPNRLRIQTIDSFNAYLTRQLPILSHFGATPDIVDQPKPLYRIAVREFLSHLEENVEWSHAIAQLLQHLDNNLSKVEELLITMLAKRDQWLPYITINANDPYLRKKLESSLAVINQDILKKLHQIFPKENYSELLELASFATKTHLTQLPNDKKNWLILSKLLLTKDFEWRKKITVTEGFPAPSSSKNAEEKSRLKEMKQRMENLLNQFRKNEPLRVAFEELMRAPDSTYDENQWKTLDALHDVLSVVVAQLKLTFQQYRQIDFIENAQAAQTALGSLDAPTDLTLALDYQIHHILIDEFQDTSNSQYRLIEKLTAGWETHDGRTLFLVGDPMQSIYRFREAEVGLFIRACERGIGNIPLEPLTLSVNFRSKSYIVNWVNKHFTTVFPDYNDIASGAVSYSPSVTKESDNTGLVELHPFSGDNKTQQTEAIIHLIRQHKQDTPKEKMAILVRARSHLEDIIPALKNAGITYRAIEIDPLNENSLIQDLIALTRALLHPADKIAWLAVLRAPWCGLSLSDLLHIAGDSSFVTIWEQLQSAELVNKLSEDGQSRLLRILTILQEKISDRSRYSIRTWIESAWLQLGGPACVEQSTQLDDADAFFKLLEKIERDGNGLNSDDLIEQTSQLFASPNHHADDSLQIMTLHNAKGLEFDTIILPHLERKIPNDKKQLLLWMERQHHDENTSSLVLAPIDAIGQEDDLIYRYIRNQQTIKNNFETGRLLYVAVTRAKKQAHLFFDIKNNDSGEITEKSLLEKLWPSIKHKIPTLMHPVENTTALDAAEPRYIKRLSLNWNNPVNWPRENSRVAYHQQKIGFALQDNTAKVIGIVVHQILQQMCQFGIDWWQNNPQTSIKTYIKRQLIGSELLTTHLNDAVDIVLRAIHNTINDTRGQWIIKPHESAESEYHLTAMINGKIQNIIIDRTFIDEQGTRWIIDYKTSLEVEPDKYTDQMQQYLQAMRLLDSRPIKLALYFPLIPAWEEL
jgi:ATP-dependent exoDNAse (exonuclease V) beta subunit